MQLYEKPLNEILIEYINVEEIKKNQIITKKQILLWLGKNYPDFEDSTVDSYLRKMTTNDTGRLDHTVVKGSDDIFYKISARNRPMQFQLYDSSKHEAPIYTKDDINHDITAIDESLLVPTSDPDDLELKVKELLKYRLRDKPKGNQKPKKSVSTSITYYRDPHVKAWILQNANGSCELCESDAPFRDATGIPFLEVHHIHSLAEEGPDTIYNAVALCPNCHRKCHYSVEHEQLRENLSARTVSKRN